MCKAALVVLSVESHLEADAEGEGKRNDDNDPRDSGQEESAQPDAAEEVTWFGFVG